MRSFFLFLDKLMGDALCDVIKSMQIFILRVLKCRQQLCHRQKYIFVVFFYESDNKYSMRRLLANTGVVHVYV